MGPIISPSDSVPRMIPLAANAGLEALEREIFISRMNHFGREEQERGGGGRGRCYSSRISFPGLSPPIFPSENREAVVVLRRESEFHL